NTVVLAGGDRDLETALGRAGFSIRAVHGTAYDRDGAARIDHFDTYNRTEVSRHVADIVHELDAHPGAMLVAGGELGPAALLAIAVVPVTRAVIDVEQFDGASDQAFVDRLYIPGIRRAGDFRTAIGM